MSQVRTPRRHSVATIMVVAVLLGAAACGGDADGDPVGVEINDDFQAQLADLAATDGDVAVADLTGFDWDTLNIFSEGDSAEAIASAAGGPVIGDEFFATAGNLWVFSADGAPVAAYATIPDNLTGTRDPLGAAARITSTSGLLQLSEG